MSNDTEVPTRGGARVTLWFGMMAGIALVLTGLWWVLKHASQN